MHGPARSALSAFVLLVVVSGCTTAAGPRTGPRPADTVTISVVGTADLHGAVMGTNTRGGLALFGGYVRNLRAARASDDGAVLLVDAGDMFQGTLESNINEGAAVIAAYNALGYHAAAIGNHEFDFGPAGERVSPGSAADDPQGALKARAAEARFPLLAANVVDRSSGAPVSWRNVAPSTLLEIAGVRVGVVGVTTESTPGTTLAANLMGLAIAPLAQTIVREAERLRARGAAVVVVAAHAGGRCREWRDPDDLSSCDPDGEIFRAARSLPPGLVDVIVGGHTHVRVAHRVAGTTIIQAGVRGAAFVRADILVERRTRAVSSVRLFPPQEVCRRVDRTTGTCGEAEGTDAVLVDAVYEGRPVVPDDAVAAALEPAIRRVEALKNTSLGVVVDEPLPREPLAESALGNLLTEAVRMSVPGTDVVLLNGGGIRTPLPAGELTYGRLFEVFPFDNRLVTLTMRGEQLRRIVAHNLQATNPGTEIIALAGVRVGAACEGSTLYVRLSRPSGAPITDAEQVRVTTVDFVASGGDGLLGPAGALQPLHPDANSPLLRDVVAGWLRTRGGHLAAGEFIRERRWEFPGTRPVRCAAADR